jgi:hypothetical protein
MCYFIVFMSSLLFYNAEHFWKLRKTLEWVGVLKLLTGSVLSVNCAVGHFWTFFCSMFIQSKVNCFWLWDCVLLSRLRSDVSGSSVADRVRRGVTPFLRCAALFFNCLTGVPPPEELSSTTGRYLRAQTTGGCTGIEWVRVLLTEPFMLSRLQLHLKARWRHCAVIWHCPAMCSSSSRSTVGLSFPYYRGNINNLLVTAKIHWN